MIDINKFKTHKKLACPVCGYYSYSTRVEQNKIKEGKAEWYLCKKCNYRYRVLNGVRDDCFISMAHENWCDFQCYKCKYYDCVRAGLECVNFELYLDKLQMKEETYNRLVDMNLIFPYISGRRNEEK